MKVSLGRAAAMAAGLVCVSNASAGSIDLQFARVGPTSTPWNPAGQFSASVSDVAGSSGQVAFRFANNVSGVSCSVTDLYFDSHGASPLGALLTPTVSSADAMFVSGTAGALPGSGALANAFVTTMAFSSDAGDGSVSGLNRAGDWVEVRFTLAEGKTFDDVIAAINSQDLRLGLRAKAILSGPVDIGDFEDSFINTITAVPLPTAVWSGLGVLGGIVVAQWRRHHRR